VLVRVEMNTAAHADRAYSGPERRRHKVYVTRNSEYHCRDGICIAVRSMQTGELVPDHSAIGRRISAGVRFDPNGGVASLSPPDAPHVGDQLCFSASEPKRSPMDVITSPLRAVVRPPRDVVQEYPN
jgi:hypothetical protein